MVRACSALNCSNRYFPGNPSAFHRFPLQDKARLREWVKNMQRKDFSPTNTCYLCSDHFEDPSYWKGHSVKLLKDDAVPTIFDFTKSNTKKSRKRRISKETSKDNSSESDHLTSAKKTTSKCKKKNENDCTTFSTEFVKKNKIRRKSVISDTKTDSISDVDSVSFIDEILIDNSGEIIIFNIDSDQEMDLIKDKYVKADHSYVWPVQSDDAIEATDKELVSGVAICKKRSVKPDDFNKSIDNTESATISNDFNVKTLDFDLTNCNRLSDSKILQNECNMSSVKLNNSDKIAEIDFKTDVFKSLAVTDTELFEAIKEMGKTNAVILLVKDEPRNKEAYEVCEVGEILDNTNSSNFHVDNISFETMEDVGEFERDHEKSAAFSSKFVCNDNEINKRKLIGSYDDSHINESDELEIGEFCNSGLKIAGEIGKSNAEIIKMLQLKNLQDSEDLIKTINVQKEEIDRLKKLLLYERTKR